MWPSGDFFSDGSGGKYARFVDLRRVGAGVASMSLDAQFEWGVYAAVPGNGQTVHRAELFVVIIICSHLEEGGWAGFVVNADRAG